MAPSTLGQLRTELSSFAGLDIEEGEATKLIERKHREMCTRAEWTRANLSLGPTAPNVPGYVLPASTYRPLKVWVNDLPYVAADEDSSKMFKAGWDAIRVPGIWWLSFDASGVEKLAVYPTPTEAGLSIVALSIVYPPELANKNDTVKVPEEYCEGLLDGCAAIAYSRLEDNADLRERLEDSFEVAVGKLRRLRLSRTGRGPTQMRILGIHV